ncbi:hypothetical protein [Cytophaga sp. FL35]|uniref:hypothetical protein n=1 Tax=Cytophaga sp. FL35 TaxID=1904456 RepID=UPI001653670C|nr:hypothetical protein [Cytophaga sp. FL35]MBC6999681.1 hypothetical protein [Cytophaga sp. FL35]
MTKKKMTRSEAARKAATDKWTNDPQAAKESLKRGWKSRKEKALKITDGESSFTMNERKAFSLGKLNKSHNYAMIYLREIGIPPDRKDGIQKAVKRLVSNEYKDTVNFYKQFLSIVHSTIEKGVEIDIWKFMEEINKTRISNKKEVYRYNGELLTIIGRKPKKNKH